MLSHFCREKAGIGCWIIHSTLFIFQWNTKWYTPQSIWNRFKTWCSSVEQPQPLKRPLQQISWEDPWLPGILAVNLSKMRIAAASMLVRRWCSTAVAQNYCKSLDTRGVRGNGKVLQNMIGWAGSHAVWMTHAGEDNDVEDLSNGRRVTEGFLL